MPSWRWHHTCSMAIHGTTSGNPCAICCASCSLHRNGLMESITSVRCRGVPLTFSTAAPGHDRLGLGATGQKRIVTRHQCGGLTITLPWAHRKMLQYGLRLGRHQLCPAAPLALECFWHMHCKDCTTAPPLSKQHAPGIVKLRCILEYYAGVCQMVSGKVSLKVPRHLPACNSTWQWIVSVCLAEPPMD